MSIVFVIHLLNYAEIFGNRGILRKRPASTRAKEGTKDSGNQQYANRNQDSPPQPSKMVTCKIKQEGTTIECNWPESKTESYLKRLSSPENAPNIGLFFVGLGGIIAAVCTLWAIRRQVNWMETQAVQMSLQLEQMEKVSEIENKTLILQYRPRIAVRNTVAKHFSVSSGESAKCTLAFQLVNVGGSPAHIIGGELYLLSFTAPLGITDLHLTESTHGIVRERTLQPGQRENFEDSLDTKVVTDAEWADFHEGKSAANSIYLLGTIWYKDDLSIPREAGIHRKYDPKVRRFEAQKESEEEYSD